MTNWTTEERGRDGYEDVSVYIMSKSAGVSCDARHR